MFRLIYNGDVLTGRMDKCPINSEICSLDVLFDTLGSFATNNRPSCAVDLEGTNFFGSLMKHTSKMMKDPMEKYVVVGISLSSALFGWFITYMCLRRKVPCKGRRKPVDMRFAQLQRADSRIT